MRARRAAGKVLGLVGVGRSSWWWGANGHALTLSVEVVAKVTEARWMRVGLWCERVRKKTTAVGAWEMSFLEERHPEIRRNAQTCDES